MATNNLFRRYIEAQGDDVEVEEGIVDRTSTRGMTARALRVLEGARQGAKAVGLAKITITAGKGGGHRSHGAGTEWDIKGYNRDGSLWSNAQRVGVAEGARQASADRIGVYRMESGLGAGTLHLGYSGPGRPAAVWGANGLTSGPKSRQFTNPAEKAFYDAYANGRALDLSDLSVSWTSASIPTPRNPIPGVPDPTAPIPRMRPAGPLSATAAAAVGAQGAASTSADLTPAPIPRDRPDPLEKTIARVVTKKGLLKKGAKGEEVAEVQRVLNAMGITDDRGRPLDVDGNLGTRTRQAIANYQDQFSHLRTDGILGTRTLAQLMNDVARTVAPTMEAGMVLDPGMAGSEMSPVAQIAANMGADIARGFQSPRAVYGDIVREIDAIAPGQAARQIGSIPGGRLSPEFVPSTPAYRTGMEGSPELPSRRLAAEMEVANAFTPHLGTGKLGTSRGLSFDTLNRDAQSIYSATDAFARARVEARERGPSRFDFDLDRGGRGFEFGTDRDAAGRAVSAGLSLKGTGSVGIGSGAGFRAGLDFGSRGDARGGGFKAKGSGSTGASAGGRANIDFSRGRKSGISVRASGGAGVGASASGSASNRSGTVRRTGSFGHTRSGRPIGGV